MDNSSDEVENDRNRSPDHNISESDHEVRVETENGAEHVDTSPSNPDKSGRRLGKSHKKRALDHVDIEDDSDGSITLTGDKNRKKRKRKSKKKKDRSKKRRFESEESSEEDSCEISLQDQSEIRSVLSETVSNNTYFDKKSEVSTTSHNRFDPRKKSKLGPVLSQDMMEYVADNFTLFIQNEKIEDLILKSYPVPESKDLSVKKVDPLVKSILEEQKRFIDKNVDQALTSIQNRLLMTMGPLGHLWLTLDKLFNSLEISPDEDNAHAHIDNLDIRQLVDLVEKTIFCLGQANISINYQRRAAILTKITNDSVKTKRLLREKQEVLARSGDQLFGNDFKNELKEYTDIRKEASKMAEALGAPKIKKRDDQPQKHYRTPKRPSSFTPLYTNYNYKRNKDQRGPRPFQSKLPFTKGPGEKSGSRQRGHNGYKPGYRGNGKE